MALYFATFSTFATIPVCQYVSLPCNLCNHTCLSLCLCTLQPLQSLQPYLSLYLSLYLATFSTFATIPVCLCLYLSTFPTIPVCLSVSVPCNLWNLCNHTCLSICLCSLQPFQHLQPYMSVHMSLYLATLATIPVCVSVCVPRIPCNHCNHTCLSICLCTLQPFQPLQPYLSVYLSLYLATFSAIPVSLFFVVPRNLCILCN